MMVFHTTYLPIRSDPESLVGMPSFALNTAELSSSVEDLLRPSALVGAVDGHGNPIMGVPSSSTLQEVD